GKPLSIGHFVNNSGISAIFSVITNTYSPYIAVGDVAIDPDQDEIIRGQDYQEVVSNFPFSSELFTGLFLEMEVSGPDGPTETFERELVDRIGFAVRQSGGSSNIGASDGTPVLTELDVFTVYALPGLYDPTSSSALGQRLEQQRQTLQAQRASDNSFPPEASATLRA